MKRNIVPMRLAIGATTAVAAVLALGLASPAAADTPQQTVRWTKIGIYPHTGPSWSTPRSGAAVSDGTVVTVFCEVDGDPITSDAATNDTIWASTNIGYLPNAFLDSGYDGRTPGVPDCDVAASPAAPAPAPAPATPSNGVGPSTAPGQPTAPTYASPTPSTQTTMPHLSDAGAYGIQWTDAQIASTSSYNRAAAARWALANFATWDGGYDRGDCTYFTSTMLHKAAGWPTTDAWTNSVAWWNWGDAASWSLLASGPSKDFVAADYFKNWMENSGYAMLQEVTQQGKSGSPLPSNAQVGDIVQYDYENTDTGAKTPDGKMDHTMIIVGFDGSQALVVGVDDPPLDANGKPHPDLWQNAISPNKSFFSRYPGARAYLLHVNR